MNQFATLFERRMSILGLSQNSQLHKIHDSPLKLKMEEAFTKFC